MIDVVFSDSAKGSMKMAKRYDEFSSVGFIVDVDKKVAKTKVKNQNEGKSLDGSPEDVVNIGFALDIGDISGNIYDTKRKAVFQNIFNSTSSNEEETEIFFNNQQSDLEKLLFAAKNNEKIRIWKGSSPFSACGFAFVCYTLRNIHCKINVISLPEYRETDNDIIEFYRSWGQIHPSKFHTFLSYEKELSNMEKQIQSNLWKELKIENAPLRAIVNGKLISVPEDFYDHIIIKNIPNGDFEMTQLIGKILGKYELGVGDGWYALRIKKLIERKVLEVIRENKSYHLYNIILKKVDI